jgi:hypothetical protein
MVSLVLLLLFSSTLSVPSSTVFSPKVAHTIILFNQPLDRDSPVELVAQDGTVITTLSKTSSTFGINFGVNISLFLRFQRPVSYQIFEPKLSHASYILSTLLYDDFVVATSGICLRNDFHASEGNYGFFYLQDGNYDAKLFQMGLSAGGTLEYATSTERKLPVRSPNIPKLLQLAKFSEWNIEMPSTEASRALSISFETTKEEQPRFPQFRQKFDKDSPYLILTKSHNFELPIDPECAENPTDRPGIRDKPLWKDWRDDWTEPKKEIKEEHGGVPPLVRNDVIPNQPAEGRRNVEDQPGPRHRDVEEQPAGRRRDVEEQPGPRRRDVEEQRPGGRRDVEEQPAGRRRDVEEHRPGGRREVEEQRAGGRREVNDQPPVRGGGHPTIEGPPKRVEAQAVVQQPIHPPRHSGFSWWTLLIGLGVVGVIALLVGMFIGNWLFPAPPTVDEGSLVAGAVRRGIVQPGSRQGKGGADGYGIPLVVPRQNQFLQV